MSYFLLLNIDQCDTGIENKKEHNNSQQLSVWKV